MTTRSRLQLISVLFLSLLSTKTGHGADLLPMSKVAPTEMLCRGYHWKPGEANLKMKEFATTYKDKKTWEKRKQILRQGILDGLHWDQMPKMEGNFNPIIHSRREMDGYVVENIAIESFPGFWITGNLYSPIKPKAKNPAILNPHGHLANKRLTDYMQIRCAAFARMGAIAFAYDMVGYAESDQTTHKMPIAALLQTWNSTRVLDYLLSRPDVDPKRIGMTGGSGGGTQTFVLTAIDDRITVSAPVVQISAHFFGGCVCESGMPIHKSNRHQTNNVEFGAMAAPRPLLMVSNGADWTRNTPNIEFPYVQKVYALYDAEHNAENVHLPLESHDYGISKRAAAYGFFAHHFNLSRKAIPYNEGWDESFVTILKPEELKVFNDQHPRPDGALQGDEEVMGYLGFKNG